MPFVAERDGQIVTPNMVSKDDDDVICPACEEEMTVRRAHYRGDVFVARHFAHLPDVDCEGESDEHLRMKAIAHSKLEQEFPEATVHIEEQVAGRQADLLVEFDDPRTPYGKGIAVEVQYHNYTKDKRQTEEDYLDEEYSVLWLYQHHYSGMDVSIDHTVDVWPNAVTHPSTDGYPTVSAGGAKSLERSIPVPNAGTGSEKARRILRWHWMKGRIEHVEEQIKGGDEVIVEETADTSRGSFTLTLTRAGDDYSFEVSKSTGSFQTQSLEIDLDPRTDVPRLLRFALDADTLHRAAEIDPGAERWQAVLDTDLGVGRRGQRGIEYGVDEGGDQCVRVYTDGGEQQMIMPSTDDVVKAVIESAIGLTASADPIHLESFNENHVRQLP